MAVGVSMCIKLLLRVNREFLVSGHPGEVPRLSPSDWERTWWSIITQYTSHLNITISFTKGDANTCIFRTPMHVF